jgi:hypothetical protein
MNEKLVDLAEGNDKCVWCRGKRRDSIYVVCEWCNKNVPHDILCWLRGRSEFPKEVSVKWAEKMSRKLSGPKPTSGDVCSFCVEAEGIHRSSSIDGKICETCNSMVPVGLLECTQRRDFSSDKYWNLFKLYLHYLSDGVQEQDKRAEQAEQTELPASTLDVGAEPGKSCCVNPEDNKHPTVGQEDVQGYRLCEGKNKDMVSVDEHEDIKKEIDDWKEMVDWESVVDDLFKENDELRETNKVLMQVIKNLLKDENE